MNLKEKIFHQENLISSLVIYEWHLYTDIHKILEILLKIAKLIGIEPDHVGVYKYKNYKNYTFKNFIKRDVINKDEWISVDFLWKRYPDRLSSSAVEFCGSIDDHPYFAIYVDHAAVDNISAIERNIIDIINLKLQPIYGIGFTVPYFWGPSSFAQGSTSSIYIQETDTFYKASKDFQERADAFSSAFIADSAKRGFDHKIRDVFELNFLSEGHLKQSVRGVPFGEWIEKSGHGRLTRASEVTWLWEIDADKVAAAREALGDVDFVIVKF